MRQNTYNDHVYHGSEWPEHEDYLVGNLEGLKKMQSAITEALETGESSIDAGEFVGVRCLDTKFFDNKNNDGSELSGILGWSVVIAIIAIFSVGLKTVLSWLIT